MEQLRDLDAKVTSYSIATGVLGALLLGCGMSFIMSDLGTMFGVGYANWNCG